MIRCNGWQKNKVGSHIERGGSRSHLLCIEQVKYEQNKKKCLQHIMEKCFEEKYKEAELIKNGQNLEQKR